MIRAILFVSVVIAIAAFMRAIWTWPVSEQQAGKKSEPPKPTQNFKRIETDNVAKCAPRP
jgi:hypothetical protein